MNRVNCGELRYDAENIWFGYPLCSQARSSQLLCNERLVRSIIRQTGALPMGATARVTGLSARTVLVDRDTFSKV